MVDKDCTQILAEMSIRLGVIQANLITGGFVSKKEFKHLLELAQELQKMGNKGSFFLKPIEETVQARNWIVENEDKFIEEYLEKTKELFVFG